MILEGESPYVQDLLGQIRGLKELLAITLEVAGDDTDTRKAVVQQSQQKLLEIVANHLGPPHFQQGVTDSFTAVCKKLGEGPKDGQPLSFTALE